MLPLASTFSYAQTHGGSLRPTFAVSGGGQAAASAPVASVVPTAANPVGQAQPASSPAPAQPPASTSQQQQQPAGVPVQQGLQALQQQFGSDYLGPIVAPDGTVYLEPRQPQVVQGQLVLQMIPVAKIDSATNTMQVDGDFLQQWEAKQQLANATVVQIDGKYYWREVNASDSSSSGSSDGSGSSSDGSVNTTLVPMSDSELQQYQAQQQQQQAQQNLQQYNQQQVDWMQKLGTMSGWMKTIGFTGGLVDQMMQGPNPYTGSASANWLSGYMILTMIDGQAGGKLLPHWLTQGPLGNVINWGIQGMFFAMSANDVKTLAEHFPRVAGVMHTFMTPTRALIDGVKKLGTTAGEAVDKVAAAGAGQAVAGAEAAGATAQTAAAATSTAASAEETAASTAAEAATSAGHLAGVAGSAGGLGQEAVAAARAAQAGGSAAGAAGAAATSAEDYAKAVGQVAKGLAGGDLKLVGAGDMQNAAALVDGKGVVSLVPKQVVYDAVKTVTPAVTGVEKVSNSISNAIGGALKAVKPALGPLKLFGGLLGAVAGGMNVALTVKNLGWKALFTTKDGRGALFGLLGATAFLGLLALPSLTALPEIGIIASAMNLATNVFNGVSMLNYSGLFGGGGFLDHDAVRAAFLIPPLTPLGLAAMLLKRNENKTTAAAAATKQKEQDAVSKVQALQQQAASQLQQSGTVTSGVTQSDGSIALPTGVSNDLSASSTPTASGGGGFLHHALQIITWPLHELTGQNAASAAASSAAASATASASS